MAVLVTLERKNKRQRHPPGGDPHSWRTRGAEAERGLGPEPGPARRALPKRGGASTGEEKEKGDYGELQLAVCKRKYEGAEVRHGGPKPAAANANHLAYELLSTTWIAPRLAYGGPKVCRLINLFVPTGIMHMQNQYQQC